MVFSSVTGKRALMWRLRPLVFVAAGGWKAIPEGPALKAGKVDTRVASLRAQLSITGARRLAPVALVMPMYYTSLLWAALLVMWIVAELPSHSSWLGAPLIIASGLVIVWREHRLARQISQAANEAVSA